jgi:hypothetical protein
MPRRDDYGSRLFQHAKQISPTSAKRAEKARSIHSRWNQPTPGKSSPRKQPQAAAQGVATSSRNRVSNLISQAYQRRPPNGQTPSHRRAGSKSKAKTPRARRLSKLAAVSRSGSTARYAGGRALFAIPFQLPRGRSPAKKSPKRHLENGHSTRYGDRMSTSCATVASCALLRRGASAVGVLLAHPREGAKQSRWPPWPSWPPRPTRSRSGSSWPASPTVRLATNSRTAPGTGRGPYGARVTVVALRAGAGFVPRPASDIATAASYCVASCRVASATATRQLQLGQRLRAVVAKNAMTRHQATRRQRTGDRCWPTSDGNEPRGDAGHRKVLKFAVAQTATPRGGHGNAVGRVGHLGQHGRLAKTRWSMQSRSGGLAALPKGERPWGVGEDVREKYEDKVREAPSTPIRGSIDACATWRRWLIEIASDVEGLPRSAPSYRAASSASVGDSVVPSLSPRTRHLSRQQQSQPAAAYRLNDIRRLSPKIACDAGGDTTCDRSIATPPVWEPSPRRTATDDDPRGSMRV